MAKCLKCGKENEKGKTMCANCGASLIQPQQSTQNLTNNGKPPKDISTELIKYADALNILAILLALVLILGGIGIAYSTASVETVTQNASGLFEQTTNFDWALFISTIVTYLIYSVIEYGVFVAISLILRAHSVIIHTTRCIATNAESISKSKN